MRFHREHPAYTRLLVWWLLNGRDVAELDLQFDEIRAAVARAYGSGSPPKFDPLVVAEAVALIMLGANVFRPFLDAQVHADGASSDQRPEALEELASLLHLWNQGLDE